MARRCNLIFKNEGIFSKKFYLATIIIKSPVTFALTHYPLFYKVKENIL